MLCAPLVLLPASGCRRQEPRMRSTYGEAASKYRELANENWRLEKRVQELEAENKALRAELERVRGGKTPPTGKGDAR